MQKLMLPISVIVTCFNEEGNVAAWVESLLAMDAWPSEIVISDSDSTDNTVELLRTLLSDKPFKLAIISGRCSISEGRNRAVAHAQFERLAITDFGVTFDRQWLSALNSALAEHDWVGGCYSLAWRNPVQRAFSRLFDVPPAALDENTFLPSSRSFAITRTAFLESGGYNTTMVLGEDTEFVLRLRTKPLRYRLERSALVYWLPRKSLREVYTQNFRYAYWDGRAAQSKGRWLHLLFWAIVTLGPLTVAFFSSPLLQLAVAGSVFGVLFLKVSRNTLRSTSRSLAKPFDLLVYYVTTTGSVLGYLNGIWSRLRSSNS